MKETIDLLGKILTNILTALYEPFGFSLLLSFLAMFFYLYAYEPSAAGKGWKSAIVTWYQKFKESVFFRRLFFLAFVTSLILFRTLLNRQLWMNPLKSVPSLRRRQEGKSKYECELIKGIALMRSLQFAKFIWKIDVVPYWEAKLSDINIDALAQHYGFDTCLLDLTNDFRTALFFATCKYDYKTDSYRPLTKKDIEATEDSKYGVIFHSPNWVLDYLNGGSFEWHMRHLNDHREEPYSFYSGELDGMAFQIGYQPLMRCHHQSGYIMPMMNATPLQSDNRFEKIRFLQTEELSNRVYEMMDKGKKIFPYEGIGKALDILHTIQKAVIFSEDDLLYAYDYGVVDKKMFPTIDDLRKAITAFQVDGECVSIQKDEINYPISPSVLQEINAEYNGRNLLDVVGNMIHQYPEQRRYREQRCIDIYGKLI